jgi:hypothetical protein
MSEHLCDLNPVQLLSLYEKTIVELCDHGYHIDGDPTVESLRESIEDIKEEIYNRIERDDSV